MKNKKTGMAIRFTPAWVVEELLVSEGCNVPTFTRGYKFRPKIGRITDEENYCCAREQLWAMEMGLTDWALPD